MLTKTTKQYAFHDIALECDIYEDDVVADPTLPVVLYFHPGSLTGGTRELVSPWVVQSCVQRRWPLISASYRFLPQVSAHGVVDDALAAYTFAQSWRASDGTTKRRVILAGASAGFFVANMIAHHPKDTQAPIAMLCITGVPTIRHSSFNSSIQLTPESITYDQVKHWLEGPLSAGDLPEGEQAFTVEMLGPDNKRNAHFKSADVPPATSLQRWDLYDYFVAQNLYPEMLNSIDPGFSWTQSSDGREKLERWPPSIFIQGAADTSVPLELVTDTITYLGPNKATLFLADDEPHLFESTSFLEDQSNAMNVVRAAMLHLDKLVQ